MKNKWLYTFRVNRTIEVDETTDEKNDKGEDVKVTKKIKKTRPVLFRLSKPGRKVFDDGELYYGIKLSEGIKAGLLTRALLAKRYQNDGGALSEPEKERYSELYLEMFEKENELQRLQINLEKLSEEEKKDKITDLLVEMAELRRELQDFETSQSALFDQTAETRAKNKTIMWWVLQLAHIEKKSDEVKDYHWYNKEEDGDEGNKELVQKEIDKLTWDPIFKGDSFDDKMTEYDNIEDENDDFWNEGLRKLAYFVSYWYSGQADSEEDFQRVEDFLNTQEGADLAAEADKEEPEEEVKEELKEEVKEEPKEEVVKVKKDEPAPAKKEPKKEEAAKPEVIVDPSEQEKPKEKAGAFKG